jgi:decaprenylphospho-beta-D-ribofuranose 2-oxidase
MPSADAALSTAPANVTLTQIRTRVSGWGGGGGVPVRVVRPGRIEGLRAALELARDRDAAPGLIARGMGRSYGDAAQLRDGLVLDTTAMNGFELDPERGTVAAEAGVTIGELLDRLVPAGWMVPVVPGTQHVSVGGAIASDIHGKNHGMDGTFGSHVEALALLTAAGEVVEVSPEQDRELFAATLGGMGLTGVILWARIRLKAVASALVSVDTDRVASLERALAVLSSPGGPYRVAWLDLLGPGIRGIVTRAEHLPASAAPAGRTARATVPSRAAVPTWFPSALLRPATVRAFNALRYARSPRAQRGHPEPIGAHMFPLDALDAWPRLYGPHGFVQYQLVVPYGAEGVIEAVIGELRGARVPCYLCVLKDMGEANGAPLSFPVSGWTITLDLPRAADGLWAALDRCDELVASASGRVYLSKDARMRPAALEAMYPRLAEWREARERADPDRLWRSDLALRTGLVDGALR